jgi:protein SCO1/2
MSGRQRIGIAAILTLLTLTCAAGFALWRLQAPPATDSGAVGGPFTLVDQDGRNVTDANFRGKWLLIYFGYTHCPDACPTALNDIAEALDRLGPSRGKIQPLFITLDPDRDTPPVLKDYTGAFAAGIVGLTGTAAQVAAAAHNYRITYAKQPSEESGEYGIEHTSIIFLMDPTGHLSSIFSHETPPDRLARRILEATG